MISHFLFILVTTFSTISLADVVDFPQIVDSVREENLLTGEIYISMPGADVKTGEDKINTYYERHIRADDNSSLLTCRKIVAKKEEVGFRGRPWHNTTYTCIHTNGVSMKIPEGYKPKFAASPAAKK
jgi:hypothetical protein